MVWMEDYKGLRQVTRAELNRRGNPDANYIEIRLARPGPAGSPQVVWGKLIGTRGMGGDGGQEEGILAAARQIGRLANDPMEDFDPGAGRIAIYLSDDEADDDWKGARLRFRRESLSAAL
jgi:hypothetical protein